VHGHRAVDGLVEAVVATRRLVVVVKDEPDDLPLFVEDCPEPREGAPC